MRLLVVTAVLAVTASLVFAWFGFLAPSRAQRQALRNQIADLEQTAAGLEVRLEQLRGLQQRAPMIRADLERLEDFVPVNPDQATLLDSLQRAADAAGITVTGLQFGSPQAVAGAPKPANPELVLGSITVVGVIEAEYFQLADFLRRLEVELPRAILVESLRVDESDEGFPKIEAEFTAQIFALIIEPESSPSDPEPTPVPVPTRPVITPSPDPAEG